MIPPSYTLATLRTVLPQQVDGDLAFAFDTPAGPIRLRMSEGEAVRFFAWLFDSMDQRRARMKVQSERSSGSPNSDGSPQEGQSV